MIESPERAMVVFAHPDDEIACAGTISLWIQQGCTVSFLVCTNGDKGTEDLQMTPVKLAQIREREQRNAAAALGVQDVVFLRYSDGELEDTSKFRGELVREIRRFRPQIVLTHAPVNLSRHIHRDHRVCGSVTLDAVFPYSRDRLHYPSLIKAGLMPHKVGTVLLWGSAAPDQFVDITATIEIKIQAMLEHSSQFIARDNGADSNNLPGEFIRDRARYLGEQAGFQFAEAFQKMMFRV